MKYTSRRALRRCTGCSSHIAATETVCPFCDTALPDAHRSRLDAWSRIGAKGTLVAGALLGLTALTGCPADDDDNNDPDMQVAVPLYGVPADFGLPPEPDMSAEPDMPMPVPQPLYGVIPTDLGTGEGDMGDMSNNETDQG